MDPLSPFFAHFALSARVFFSGRLCGISGDHATETAGHLHVLRRGILVVERPEGPPITVAQPSVLFYPRPCRHRFRTDEASGAELVCAYVEFGAGMLNPLIRALPEVLIVPLESLKELAPTVELLFTEAFGDHPGRQTAVDRLAEYFLVLLLRTAMKERLLEGGVLVGLADPGSRKSSVRCTSVLNTHGRWRPSPTWRACPARGSRCIFARRWVSRRLTTLPTGV